MYIFCNPIRTAVEFLFLCNMPTATVRYQARFIGPRRFHEGPGLESTSTVVLLPRLPCSRVPSYVPCTRYAAGKTKFMKAFK